MLLKNRKLFKYLGLCFFILLPIVFVRFTYVDSSAKEEIVARIKDVPSAYAAANNNKEEIINQKIANREVDQFILQKAKMLTADSHFEADALLVTFKSNPQQVEKITLKAQAKSLNVADDQIEKDLVELSLIEAFSDKEILVAQPNYIYTTSWTSNGDTDTPTDFRLTPSPDTGNHWYYEVSNLRQMWQDLECASGSSSCGGSPDVTVAIIDTGLAYESRTSAWGDTFAPNDDMFSTEKINLYNNPDEFGFNNIDDDENGFVDDKNGFNSANYVYCLNNYCSTTQNAETGHANDDYGHGTYVTSLIATIVDNNFGSVAPAHNVRIMPIKANIFHSNSFGSLELWHAIDYAVNNGADVINMSLGGTTNDPVLETKLEWAESNGAIIFASVGNGNTGVYYPAAFSSVIGVTSVNKDGNKASYSNFGAQVDISAYVGDGSGGVEGTRQRSYTCFPCGPSQKNFTSFANKYGEGTSYASPQVAALAAIILSVNPDLNSSQVTNYIFNTAIDLGTAGKDEQTGWGAIDWEASFLAAADDNSPPTISVIEPDGTGDNADTNYAVTWSDADSDNNASVTLYWDNDTNKANGSNLIYECQNILENDNTDSCGFDTRSLLPGTYYVHACIKDFAHPEVCDASGALTVSHSTTRDMGKASVGTDWRTVNFNTNFAAAPYVFVEVSEEYGGQKIYPQIRNITDISFEVRIQENTAYGMDNSHAANEVSWYAVQSTNSEELTGTEYINDQWTPISFSQSFTGTPYVFAIMHESGKQLAYAKVKNVSNTGFEVKIEEPTGLDGNHGVEKVEWIAFEENSAAAEINSSSVSSDWAAINFAAPETTEPILLAIPRSENSTTPARIDIRNLTVDGFEARIEREDYSTHPTETISWVIFNYAAPDLQYTKASVDSNWLNILFDEPFEDVPQVFADISTELGGDTADVDIQKVSTTGFFIRIEEDPKAWNGIHKFEDVSWIAIDKAPAGSQLGEIIINTFDQPWYTITFDSPFVSTPKVFAEIQTENGTHTVGLDIRNVQNNSFEIRLEEDTLLGWDGNHNNETIAWWAFENIALGKSGVASPNHNWQTVVYPTAFATSPILIADINSENGGQIIQVDLNNITSNNFQVRIEEELFYDGNHTNETVVWFAIE